MSLKRLRKLRAGESFTAAELNRLADAVKASQIADASGNISAAAGQGGIQITDNRPVPIWARITGGSNPYSWTQVDETDATGFGILAGGFAQEGSFTQGQAYEISARNDVPVGAKVQLHLSPTLNYYLFTYPILAAGPLDSGSGTGSGSAFGPNPHTYPNGDGYDLTVVLGPWPDCVNGRRTVRYGKVRPVFDPTTGFLRLDAYDIVGVVECCYTSCSGTGTGTGTGSAGGGGSGGDRAGGYSSGCSRNLNSVLYASLPSGDGTAALTWNGTYWTGSKVLGCGLTLYLRFSTVVGQAYTQLEYSCDGVNWILGQVQTESCSPSFTSAAFYADLTNASVGCGAPCSATYGPIVVTE